MIFSEGIIFKIFKFWRRSFLSKKKAFLAFTQGGALPDMSSTAQCRQIHVCRLQTRQTFWSSRPGGEILDPGVLKSCSHPRVLSFALPARVGVQVTGSLSRPAEHNIPRAGYKWGYGITRLRGSYPTYARYPYAFPEQRTYLEISYTSSCNTCTSSAGYQLSIERMVEQDQKEIPPWMFGIRFPFSSSAYCSIFMILSWVVSGAEVDWIAGVLEFVVESNYCH